jgi:hypothetical protein
MLSLLSSSRDGLGQPFFLKADAKYEMVFEIVPAAKVS